MRRGKEDEFKIAKESCPHPLAKCVIAISKRDPLRETIFKCWDCGAESPEIRTQYLVLLAPGPHTTPEDSHD